LKERLVVKEIRNARRSKVPKAKKRKALPEPTPQEVHIIREAMCYCLHHFPMLWTTGGLPEEHVADDGVVKWLIHVYLRYPTGHEGYLGDLLYDGKSFAELTDREVMRQRARQIEADPALQREWDEYRASTLPTRKA
jgi:hypothetical protein